MLEMLRKERGEQLRTLAIYLIVREEVEETEAYFLPYLERNKIPISSIYKLIKWKILEKLIY